MADPIVVALRQWLVDNQGRGSVGADSGWYNWDLSDALKELDRLTSAAEHRECPGCDCVTECIADTLDFVWDWAHKNSLVLGEGEIQRLITVLHGSPDKATDIARYEREQKIAELVEFLHHLREPGNGYEPSADDGLLRFVAEDWVEQKEAELAKA